MRGAWTLCKHPESCIECSYALAAGWPIAEPIVRPSLWSRLRAVVHREVEGDR